MKILYLHGFASGPSSTKARYISRLLTDAGAQVSVPDLCDGNFEGMTITGMLDVIRREAAEAPVSLIGSSLGGYLAALYASRHEEVRKVVLLAPGFEFPRRWPEQQNLAEWKKTGKLEVFHYADKRTRQLGYQLVDDARQYEDAPSFSQPGLIFHGLRDEVVPPRVSIEYAEKHPNVRLRLLASGHELTDVMDEMWAEMAPFLLKPDAS